MTLASRRLLIGCVLVAASFVAAGWGYAQGLKSVQPVAPVVLSGPDVGFRMTGRKGDTPVGELVVRIDGQWKRAEFSYAVKPASH